MVEVLTFIFYYFRHIITMHIVIGGSAFNQFDKLINDPQSIGNILAAAMPAQSSFFINMAIVQSLSKFGMELSQIVAYAVRAVMNLLFPPAARTQRALDTGAKPVALQWGKKLPPMIFIFLVSMVYMTVSNHIVTISW